MPTIESKTEISLLLYLESCAVDQCGAVSAQHMNEDDFALAALWDEAGLITFGRMKTIVMDRMNSRRRVQAPYTHRVELSDEAFALAAQHRKAKAERTRHRSLPLETD